MWILTLNRKHDLVVELSEVWDRSLSGKQTDELRTYEFARYLDKSLGKVSRSRTWPVQFPTSTWTVDTQTKQTNKQKKTKIKN